MRRCWPNFGAFRFKGFPVLWWSFNLFKELFLLLIWCYSRVAHISAALGMFIFVACRVFMSNSRVESCISQFFPLRKSSFLTTNSGGWRFWPHRWPKCPGPIGALLDNVASLCALKGNLPDNNLQTCRFLARLRCLLFPIFVLRWVMLMFSSHIAMLTGVKDCLIMLKDCSVFMVMWYWGIALWLSRWSVS